MTELSKFLQPFSTILPSMEETLLLRAGLLDEEAARRAWHEWRSINHCNFIGHSPAIQKLRLLLSQAHQRHHFEMDKESQTFLRLSYFKEGLRREIYQRLFRSVLEALERAAISVIVLKGAALAETVYPPSMRHCHDIDLLLSRADVEKAADAVTTLKFQRTASESSERTSSVRLDHESRLPLELHTRLLQSQAVNPIIDAMLARVQCRSLFGVTARILSPEDSLLHVCAHACYSANRYSLRWVSDAWHLLEKHPNFDWTLWIDGASHARLALPVSVTLSYLYEALGAPIPPTVIEQLRTAEAAEASPEHRRAKCNSVNTL